MTEKGNQALPPTRLEASLQDPEECGRLSEAIRLLDGISEHGLGLFRPGGLEWRKGRMTMRRSTARHMALRRTGGFEDLAKDAWRSLLYDNTRRVDWFLRDYMNLYPSRKPGEQRDQEDLRQALFEALSRQYADRPAREAVVDPMPWLDPTSPNPKGYLYKTVAMDAHKLWVNRQKTKHADESAKVHKTLDELTPKEEQFAAKELVREQTEEWVEEKIAEYGLPPREAEVARLMARRKNTAEIAAEMGIAASTVRATRRNIAAKVERDDAC